MTKQDIESIISELQTELTLNGTEGAVPLNHIQAQTLRDILSSVEN